MKQRKTETKLALLVLQQNQKLRDVIYNKSEIDFFLNNTHDHLLDKIKYLYTARRQQEEQEEKLADYVESLLLNPIVHADIKKESVEWFYSRMQIEKFQKQEKDTAWLIGEYAFHVFQSNPYRIEFQLISPNAIVRVFIFLI